MILCFLFHFSHNKFFSYDFRSSGSSVSSSPPNFMFSLTLLGGKKYTHMHQKKRKEIQKQTLKQANMESMLWAILCWSALPSIRPAFKYVKHTQSRSMNENWIYPLSAIISCKYLFGQRIGLGAYFPLSVLGFCLTNLCRAFVCCQSRCVWNCISVICLENSFLGNFNTSGSYCLSLATESYCHVVEGTNSIVISL